MESVNLFSPAIARINAALLASFAGVSTELIGLMRPVRQGKELLLLPFGTETKFSLNGDVELQAAHRLISLDYDAAKGQNRGNISRPLRTGKLSLIIYGRLAHYERVEAALLAAEALLLNSDLDGRNVATRLLSLAEYNFERDLYALSYSVSELTPAPSCLPPLCAT